MVCLEKKNFILVHYANHMEGFFILLIQINDIAFKNESLTH